MLTHRALGPDSFWCTEPGIYLRAKDKKNRWMRGLKGLHWFIVHLKLSTDHHSHWLARCLQADQMETSQWSISASRSLVDTKRAVRAPSAEASSLDWSKIFLKSAATHSVCDLSRIWCLSCWPSHSCRWKMKPEMPCSFWLRSFTFSSPILACTNTMNFHVLQKRRNFIIKITSSNRAILNFFSH